MAAGFVWLFGAAAAAQTLENRLASEDPGALAREAREQGDARRGAVVFHQPSLGCVQCHAPADGRTRLGPPLTEPTPDSDDARIVESILHPSKVIREGYEPIIVQRADGRSIAAIRVSEDAESIVLRDIANDGAVETIARSDIERIERGTVSIMPAGQVNQLAGRQPFLDLVKYLIEIREGGVARANELAPSSLVLGPRELPAYERNLDHAALIRDWDRAAFRRGKAIYDRLCVNCHGTHDQPGSLPTSPRFATARLKNGSDPLSMYRTLTLGFGMMAPQSWMVPRQKYDVIHYIREAYLRANREQPFTPISDDYLAGLPSGNERGPAPSDVLEWERMDYGNQLIGTYESGDDGSNLVHKGNAIRLDGAAGGVSRGRAWILYDYDTLRAAVGWTGDQFIDWNGILFTGQHAVHPRITGRVAFETPMGPGWARPGTDSFEDTARVVGRDGRVYGPLPRDWAHYRGMYQHGSDVVIHYTVGATEVWELPRLHAPAASGSVVPRATVAAPEAAPAPVFERVFRIGPRSLSMRMRVAHLPHRGAVRLESTESGVAAFLVGASDGASRSISNNAGPDPAPHAGDAVLAVAVLPPIPGATFDVRGSELHLELPAGSEPIGFQLRLAAAPDRLTAAKLASTWSRATAPEDPLAFTRGGPVRWPERLTTRVATLDSAEGPFVVERLVHPLDNPWFCRMRFTGLDFLPDGDRLAVSDWEGNVWIVSGLASLAARAANDRSGVELTWKRIASGLFQPLGLLHRDGHFVVTCRDQICRLHDLNGDEEIDYYENVNNDHQVTEHFHEFAMGLQADPEGNFYYAKSARHALTAVVPHHGTLLKVSADGAKTEILATGFRAANGVCLNPDGTFFVTDQEGHWTPKNRINWVKPGGFYGNMFGYHAVVDPSDSAMERPLCWITNAFDRSPGELLWVTSDRWGPLQGSLLNLSYGYGKVYSVPHERIGDRMQGAMCELPIGPFPTGVMRGRFSPHDGQLYTCGMVVWASSQPESGGLYRVRYAGGTVHAPIAFHARKEAIDLTFSDPMDRGSAEDASRYAITVWSLRRSANYGSEHHDVRTWKVRDARWLDDGRTVALGVPELEPTDCIEIRCALRGEGGREVVRLLHGTIHELDASR